MTSQEEASSFRRFFQYVEDSGLRTYDGLVIQNASDIARESDRIRNQTNWAYLQEKHQKKRRQEDAIKRISEDVAMATEGTYSGKHFRMGFMTMPAPQDRLPPPSQGFTVRSQSLHSVGGGDDDSNQNPKLPPPKPRRDPNTKLTDSSETMNGSAPASRKDSHDTREIVEHAEAKCHLYSEDFKKMPPPKPKRNPNTQLSTSFDESYIRSHGSKKSSLRWDSSLSQSQSPASRDTDDEEPVYIEMVGNILREVKCQEALEDEQNESVYEEMKYPMEDFLQEAHSAFMDPEGWSSRDSIFDIPPPFPNLLTHRPPLLVFPPAPAQCSPNSDESPLTPLEVTRLPMMDNVSYSKSGGVEQAQTSSHHRKEKDRHQDREQNRERDLTSTHTITSSGRSSAPPLPSNLYKSSNSAHGGHGYPRSQSACPSPVSMGRSLTPLSLKRPPPYDVLMAGGSMPRSSSSSSSSSQRAGEGGAKLSNSSSTHGSMQNVSMRSQTPTSPLDDLNNMFTSGRKVMKKGSRKSRNSEGDSRSLPRQHSKDRDGQSSPVSGRMGRSSVSPTMMLCGGGAGGGGGAESKSACKLGRSASTSGVPSPGGTPQRHQQLHPALSQMPWLCGDSTMMEMIEKKRVLCREIKARQRPEKNLCKQDSMPILPSWRRKQPPPYSAPPTSTAGHSSTVFWDTAI
ncbi:neuronal tyrosine-phosphorylated phosphoinositide-3-kinase adapter 2 isoform X1 [Labrus bergylta]|uniref:Neuronal tyrosine-phosphorylated phosphoinositide-3-kinase adaptor 2a n=1 Tax=Labrus bergylta TaxID=56723 RepID=A0A3Q3EHX0_9LABR|nr:neuronal tyrosine-phosphorylated phosphoinositide-3-kinase adapter 2 [Labrus bergylta]